MNDSALSATVGDKDWPEDFSHENGNYSCRCTFCGGVFTGHKRRVVCKVCATASTTTSSKGKE